MGSALTVCLRAPSEPDEEGSASRSAATPTPPSNSTRPTYHASQGKRRAGSGSIVMRPILDALRTYATLPNPSSSLPPSTLLLKTPQTIAIFDAYPKARYHFLVLPRHPFPSQSDPESSRSLVKLDHLDDLKSLLLKTSRDVREQVIAALADTAREVEEMVRDEMVKTEGFEWRVDVGFHAIPSMKHIHLHIISEDRISDSLKTKKHYNTFRPDLGFFVSLSDVQRWLEEDDVYIRERVNALTSADALLSTPLTCFKCDEPFSNMPKLKQHLEYEFETEKKEASKRHGRQGPGADESIF